MNAIPETQTATIHAAVAALHQGNLAEAERLAQRIVETRPDDFDAWHLLAVLALRREDLEHAERLYQEALQRRPGDPQVLNGLAAIALYRGQIEDAERRFREILANHPYHPEAAINLVGLLLDQERAREALPLLDSLVERSPRPVVFAHRGRARWTLGDLEGAEADYRRALAEDPGLERAWLGLGVTALERGDTTTAAEALERARQAQQRDIAAKAIFNLGYLNYQQGRYAEAAQAFTEAAETIPDGRFGLAMTQLLMGNFQEGWRNWRHRPSRQRPGPWSDPDPLPENGPAHDILVVHDEGPGDELFFLRFLPQLVAQGHRVRYLPSPLLAPVVRELPGIEVLPPGPLPEAPADQVFLTGDLAELVQAGVRSPFPFPLRLPVPRDSWQAVGEQLRQLGPPPYIGLCWHSGEDDEGRGRLLSKNAPVELLAQALGHALHDQPATLIAVMRQRDPEGEARLAAAVGCPVRLLHPEPMDELLALLDHLEDFITVPSTSLHLRASLARPARVLVPHPPEWRWGMMSQVSPWFPQFTLYRETLQGWQEAFQRLQNDLGSPAATP